MAGRDERFRLRCKAKRHSAEHRVMLPSLDQAGLALVVEAVTGSRPSRGIDQNLLRMIDIADLPVALRRATSPDACIEALESIVAAKAAA